MPTSIKDIKRRLYKASQGPWAVYDDQADDSAVPDIMDANGNHLLKMTAGPKVMADAEFIAHAREDIEYLLELLDQYR